MAKTLLAVGAHCDDCVIGIPGILVRAATRGYRIVVVALIGDVRNWPPAARMRGSSSDLAEALTALFTDYGAELVYLGPTSRSHFLDVTAQDLAGVVAEVDPDVAFVPWRRDYNDDHEAAARLGEIALRYPGPLLGRPSGIRRHRPLYAFDTGPSHTIGFDPDTFVDVTAEWPTAMEWLGQTLALVAGEPYTPDFHHEARDVKSTLAAYRGIACGARYAEALRSLDPFPRDILEGD